MQPPRWRSPPPVRSRYEPEHPLRYADWFDRLPCVDRIGRCFDASIGGQPVEVIEAEAEYQRLHDEIRRINPNLREVYWQVREPLSGSAAMAGGGACQRPRRPARASLMARQRC